MAVVVAGVDDGADKVRVEDYETFGWRGIKQRHLSSSDRFDVINR